MVTWSGGKTTGLVVALMLTAIGCGRGAALPRATLPQVPAELARCRVAANHQSPLVTEWPASEKANLEARVREGAVVVAYSGCAMRILPECRLAGGYTWQRTTPARDWLQIGNADELYAKLPLGAASLEGELSRSGSLTMETTVAGQLRLVGLDASMVPVEGECAAATHLVTGLAVGAFNLSAGGALSASASVDATVASTTAKTQSEKSLLREAGDPARCYQTEASAPHPDCNSPIQMFLTPLPGRAGEIGPPGTIKVDFYAADGDATWEVSAASTVLCKTPCSKWLDPATSLVMRQRKSWARDERVKVPSLRRYVSGGPLQIYAHPTARGKMTAGMVLTVFAGAAVVTGITLGAIDCTRDDPGSMCKAAAITLPAGVVGLIPGIWLMLQGRARAQVVGDRPQPFAGPAPGLVIGPGFASGSF